MLDELSARYGNGATRSSYSVTKLHDLKNEVSVNTLMEEQMLKSHRHAVDYLTERFMRIDNLRKIESDCGTERGNSGKIHSYAQLLAECSNADTVVNALERSLLRSDFALDDHTHEEPVNIPPQFANAEICYVESTAEHAQQEEEEIRYCGL